MTKIQSPSTRTKVFTWNVHAGYLYYLSSANVDLYIPCKSDKSDGYEGKTGALAGRANIFEIPAEKVKDMQFDVILFQSRNNYEVDQYEILSSRQRILPYIFLEHEPPREHPTDTRHLIEDPSCLVVHVTNFNNLMWETKAPSIVIDYGVPIPSSVRYTGTLNKGIAVVHGLTRRGRRLGMDIFESVSKRVPLDLVGIGSEQIGGLGEVAHKDLIPLLAQYRFFFSPARYSMGLTVCEAMSTGMPIVGVATTELATTIQNGFSGYIDTDIDKLVMHMEMLLDHPEVAHELGDGALWSAQKKFSLERFTREWEAMFHNVCRLKEKDIVGMRFAQEYPSFTLAG